MKFKTIVALMAASVLLAGCAKTQQEAATPETTSQVTETQENTEMANPWVESDQGAIKEKLGFEMKAPDGSKDISYSANKSEGMAELRFTDETGTKFTYRMQATPEFADISGLNYKWDITDDQKVAGCDGKTMRVKADGETIDLLLWYDVDSGVMHSLSATAPDLDGFDIVAVAENLYTPAKGN